MSSRYVASASFSQSIPSTGQSRNVDAAGVHNANSVRANASGACKPFWRLNRPHSGFRNRVFGSARTTSLSSLSPRPASAGRGVVLTCSPPSNLAPGSEIVQRPIRVGSQNLRSANPGTSSSVGKSAVSAVTKTDELLLFTCRIVAHAGTGGADC